jgi:hypothetical protein
VGRDQPAAYQNKGADKSGPELNARVNDRVCEMDEAEGKMERSTQVTPASARNLSDRVGPAPASKGRMAVLDSSSTPNCANFAILDCVGRGGAHRQRPAAEIEMGVRQQWRG